MKNRRYFCHAAVVMLMCLPCFCAFAQTDRKEVRAETVISGKGISVRQRLII